MNISSSLLLYFFLVFYNHFVGKMYLKLRDYLMARNGVLRSATNTISGAAGFTYNLLAVQLVEEQ